MTYTLTTRLDGQPAVLETFDSESDALDAGSRFVDAHPEDVIQCDVERTMPRHALAERFPTGARVEFVGETIPEPWGSGIERGATGVVELVDVEMYDDGDGESGPHLCIDETVQVHFDGDDEPSFIGPDELRRVDAA